MFGSWLTIAWKKATRQTKLSAPQDVSVRGIVMIFSLSFQRNTELFFYICYVKVQVPCASPRELQSCYKHPRGVLGQEDGG